MLEFIFLLVTIAVIYIYKSKKELDKVDTQISLQNNPVEGGVLISTHDLIPEPTRSLLFLTDEDTENISSPYNITIKFDIATGATSTNVEDDNFYAEPSLIWKRLPVKVNDFLEERPMYYPTYAGLTPDQRFQYLSWLKDITQPTNLSYVFLYYYGLERHLLIGDFAKAFKEILKLLQHHDRGTFREYVQNALVVAIMHKKKINLLEKNRFFMEGVSDEVLWLRKYIREDISASEIIQVSSKIGFKNKYYIKKDLDVFLDELKYLVDVYKRERGNILECVSFQDLSRKKEFVFANGSLPNKIRETKVPQLLSNKKFRKVLYTLLEETHSNIKNKKTHTGNITRI